MTYLRFGVLLLALLGLFSRGAQAQAVVHRPRVNLAAVPIGRMDLPWWRARFAQTRAEARADPGAKLIWLGDSITQYWTRVAPVAGETILPVWEHYYAPYHALDFGFIGDTTASVIWRVDHGQLAGLHPKLIVILIGANNLGLPHWGAQRTVPGIEAVVRDVHHHAPGAKILLLGVLPSIRSAWVTAQTVRINAALARIYRHNRLVTFRNPGVVLLRDGRADRNLFIDPFFAKPEPALHPNRHGMTLIAQNLAPTVTRLIGAGP
jgi:lysophospholipase L1-like esterase